MSSKREILEADCRGLTHQGKVRETNQDQFLIADLAKSMLVHQTSLALEDHSHLFGTSQGTLLVVADGMGGHAGGERASTIAVNSLAQHVLDTLPWFIGLQRGEEDDLQEELKAALQRCQRNIEAEESRQASLRGMGTTLTMAYVLWPRLYVVHAGDSRGYLFRKNALHQITKDQTVAQALVEQGTMNQEEAKGSRFSHMLSNCIGGGTPELTPEVYKATLEDGDTVLLSTDGLTNMVDDQKISELLARSTGSEEKCQRLVDAALEAGGKDNVTVVVANFHAQKNERPSSIS